MKNSEFVDALANRRLYVCGNFGYWKALSLQKLWLVESSKSVEALLLMLTYPTYMSKCFWYYNYHHQHH